MPGKPRALTPEQIERARKLVEAGYKLHDVATRFGVTTSQLHWYGIRAKPKKAKAS